MIKEIEQQYNQTSPELKELWDVEMDILSQFASVCKKHNLKWFADGGTLLGAVRHHGFIPWDDDIDVAMPYDDYMKLCELSEEFESPYFLQNWKTEDGWCPDLCKIRRSDTTVLNWREFKYPKKWNKGAFIDVFVFCNYPNNKVIANTQIRLLNIIRKLYLGYESIRDGVPASKNPTKDKLIKNSYRVISIVCDYRKLADLYMWIGGWGKKTSKCIGPLLYTPWEKKYKFKSEWFNKIIMLDFMNMSMPCPNGYDGCLTAEYGDYMTPVKASSMHGELFVDLSHSYKESIK